ncbi:hypothetical protein AVEN_31253-1 [Araneus ventricosus]|uniref:Uncharacterized protein n=1 Tax=Araneus ventricosus TaxID=182803 RepID=A0A4Y2IL51_ARAVE|nr:hypothetical protein AVEN_31253-1 [Araneus ventricosus]
MEGGCGGLVVRSWLQGRRAPGPKPDSNEDPSSGKNAEAVSSPNQRSSPGIRLTRSNWETLIRRQNRGESWKRTRKRLTGGVGQGKWCVERGSGPQPSDPDRFPCLPNNFCAHSLQVKTSGPDTMNLNAA